MELTTSLTQGSTSMRACPHVSVTFGYCLQIHTVCINSHVFPKWNPSFFSSTLGCVDDDFSSYLARPSCIDSPSFLPQQGLRVQASPPSLTLTYLCSENCCNLKLSLYAPLLELGISSGQHAGDSLFILSGSLIPSIWGSPPYVTENTGALP